MSVHRLKCWPEYFADVRAGIKNFELRPDDRDFQDGDTAILEEWDPASRQYTGHQLERPIWKVYRNLEKFGLRRGFCILQLAKY